MATTGSRYHHGDLRAALITAARESLGSGEAFSMRAIARRAGVSSAAPYRHFATREALESAVAVEGFIELRTDLGRALEELPETSRPDHVIAELGVAYVAFALRRPALFRLMFGSACDEADSERVQAAGELHTVLEDTLLRLFPEADIPALATALWSFAHGLAFLHLDGKLRPESADDVADRVRSSVLALFSIQLPPGVP